MGRASPESRLALMWNGDTREMVCVLEVFVEEKRRLDRWFLVARESWLLPFNSPRLIPDTEPLPERDFDQWNVEGD